MASLKFDGVTKHYGAVTALNNLHLEVQDGELITLLGPSGCGKTTALRVAAGFEPVSSGTVILGSNDISSVPPQRRDMGMVFQSYSLFPHLSVLENVAFGLQIRKREKFVRLQRAQEMLELVQVGNLSKRYPHQLSGGQQQRVALARALAIAPKVLLLDEPLSALDARVRVEVREEIRRLQRETGTTTLFVTHDQEEALAISDRICVMNEGEVHQIGSPREVYLEPATNFVARFIGLTDEVKINGKKYVVRPEDVRIAPAATLFEAHLATVTGIHFGGSTTLVEMVMQSDGTRIRSLTTADISGSVKIGDQLDCAFTRLIPITR